MDRIKVQVNGRTYFLKTDNSDEAQVIAGKFDEQIKYITRVKSGISEAEATAYSALLLMGDALSAKRSEADQALIDELNGKIEVLEERIDTLAVQVSEHNDTEKAVRAENDGLKKRERDYAVRIKDLSDKHKELTDAYSENERVLEDTKSALASANKLIAQINNEKFTEVTANEALRTELDVLRGKLESSNKQVAELNGKITKMEINSISVEPDGTVAVNEEELKKLRSEKEDLEIELAIANEEIEKLRAAAKTVVDENETVRKLAEAEKTIKNLESRSTEIEKLRNLLADTEQSIRHRLDEKEAENDKLRNILKNYESSYNLSFARKEEEILDLQKQIERLKNQLNISAEDNINGKYVQTTFDIDEESEIGSPEEDKADTKVFSPMIGGGSVNNAAGASRAASSGRPAGTAGAADAGKADAGSTDDTADGEKAERL